MSLAAEGMVSQFLNEKAPKELKQLILESGKKDILNETYPYKKRLSKTKYFEEMEGLQIELAKFQAWLETNSKRVVILFHKIGVETRVETLVYKPLVEALHLF